METNPEQIWWNVLSAALTVSSTSAPSFELALKDALARIQQRGTNAVTATAVAESARAERRNRVFLIDGIETAFRAERLLRAVEGLFRFLLTVQTTPDFAESVTIRLFLRTDLARRASQNVEQQTAGRELTLAWDTKSIFNFMLSRIVQLPWFQTNFTNTVGEIEARLDEVRTGMLPEDECERLLLQVFPEKIRRNNLLTLTFLRTYFSDSASEAASYYPRIYDRFLQIIANPSHQLKLDFAGDAQLENGRVSSPLIFAAHKEATQDYLAQVRGELEFLLELSNDPLENKRRVDALLQAFAGLPTPFILDSCVESLRQKLSQLQEGQIRQALGQMKEVGMFEGRPGFHGQWRVGRLFKESLGMKYVRA